MFKSNLKIYFLSTLVVLAGCASTKTPNLDSAEIETERNVQKSLELKNTLRYQERLDYIAYPLLKGGAKFCDDKVTTGIGLNVVNKYAFPEKLQETAVSHLGLGEMLEVLWVIEGTPASNSGIISGDIITHLNDEEMPSGEKAIKSYRNILEDLSGEPLTVKVLRDGQNYEYSILADRVCKYPALAILNATPNAYADGRLVAVHSGLLRMFENDRDVAIVVGHEIAHNVKRHITKGIAAGVLGAVIDMVPGLEEAGAGLVVANKFSPALEAEADYVGLYIASNSGVDINGAENVWREFAAEFAGGKEKTLIDSHPPTPERFIAIRETVKEINEKKRNGLPLTPNQ